jgi:hypothetical protein
MLGVEQDDLARKIGALVPQYMNMSGAMGDASMDMPLPANTLPMMAGNGPFGSIAMGGMFTVMKIRAGLAHGDYIDPGWYRAPAGTRAHAWQGDAPPEHRPPAAD